MSTILFNVNPIVEGKCIEKPDQKEIKSTPALFNADLQTAMLYGGDLTRTALSAMNFRGDKRHIIIDTKVHMLMKGFMPAIPGWHTDAAPRGEGLCPQGPNPPDMYAQIARESPRFHLLATGECRTDFMTRPVELDIENAPSFNLYSTISKQVNELVQSDDSWSKAIPECQVVEWNWWNIHSAVPAPKAEWRFLIRVTETDYQEPNKELSDVLRTQQQVYVPMEFGW